MAKNTINIISHGWGLPKFHNLKGFKGFTLAEVLITLVIIGVIAAMTIPTLINKTNNQEYVSRLKKAYSTMAQATNRIIAEEGNPRADIGGWATSDENVYNLYKKYLNNTKECGEGGSGCFAGTYKRLNGTSGSYEGQYALVLSDGTEIRFGGPSSDCSSSSDGSWNYCLKMLVDINGAKKPNFVGKDAFIFILKEDGLAPIGCDTDRCSKSYNGWGCACKVLREGAINYL